MLYGVGTLAPMIILVGTLAFVLWESERNSSIKSFAGIPRPLPENYLHPVSMPLMFFWETGLPKMMSLWW
jgi:hypothetical protein